MTRDIRDPQLAEWLNEGPDRGSREALEVALAAAHNVSQRPGWWSFTGKWPPMQPGLSRVHAPPFAGAVALLVLFALVLVLTAVLVGSQPRLPAPIGPAANGLVAFEMGEQIYVARVDGSARRPVNADVWPARSPEFSPDGTLLAFVSGSGFGPGRLWVVPVDGSHPPVNVSGDSLVASAYYPAISWSPDGRYIAFATFDGSAKSILVASSDGSGATAIADQAADLDLPSWSPDGSLIAFRITRSNPPSRSLAVARPDGRHERILGTVTGPEASLSLARWAPDGRRLAYYRIAPDVSEALVVDLQGTETPLWPDRAGSFADTGIPWAPDGRSIALFTADGLVVVDADGANPLRLGNLAYCWIEWSPDGTALYGPSGDHCGGGVKVIPIANPEQATTSMEGLLSWQRVAP